MPKKKYEEGYDKSPEGIAYRNQYNKDHYERINVYVTPELNERIKQFTNETGISKNRLVSVAITEYLGKMERDGE